MKILHVIPFFSPKMGGSVTVAHDLIKALSNEGHEITIITSDFQIDLEYSQSIPGVRIIHFPSLMNIGLFIFTPAMISWLKNNLKKFDIVHLHEFRSYQNHILHRYATRLGIPYVVQAHGSTIIVGGKTVLKSLYDLVWGKRIARGADSFIAITELEKNHYLKYGISESKIKIIPNSIFPEKYSMIPIKGKFKNENDIDENTNIILYMGRLNKIKGIETLILGYSMVLKERESTLLIIAGPDDGNEFSLRKLTDSLGISHKVKFFGFINDPISFYRGADIVVYPSLYEIFGMVPFESIMSGTPVIVSEDSGCGRICEKIRCGLTISKGDPSSIKKSIIYLLDNKSEGKDMVISGQNYIFKNLNWHKNVKIFESIYQTSIDKYKHTK